MRNKLLPLLLLNFALTYTGCTSGRTIVMNAPTERVEAVSLSVVEDQSTVSVPHEVAALFRDKLDKALFEDDEGSPPLFTRGPGVSVHYRFIQFSPGSQFKRWLGGGIGGYGEGSMTVEVKFVNPAGKEVSKIQSEGKIGAGVFGGSIDGAVQKCVEEVAQYVRQNFRCPFHLGGPADAR